MDKLKVAKNIKLHVLSLHYQVIDFFQIEIEIL